MYDPTEGRFITADPIETDPNRYRYVGGNPTNYVDSSGLGAVWPDGTPIGGTIAAPVPVPATPAAPKLVFEWDTNKTIESCGGVHVTGFWSLAGHPKVNGWVIQRVFVAARVYDCEGNLLRDTSLDREKQFYEAWEVHDGTVYQGKYVPGGLNEEGEDSFDVPDCGEGTQGYLNVRAVAQFLPNYSLGNTWSLPGQPGHIDVASDLPTMPYVTGQRPAGWDSLGGFIHSLSVSWCCCPDSPNVTKFSTTPPFPQGTKGN
jgi:hypothetical protein